MFAEAESGGWRDDGAEATFDDDEKMKMTLTMDGELGEDDEDEDDGDGDDGDGDDGDDKCNDVKW